MNVAKFHLRGKKIGVRYTLMKYTYNIGFYSGKLHAYLKLIKIYCFNDIILKLRSIHTGIMWYVKLSAEL